jgi:hypothetical protein
VDDAVLGQMGQAPQNILNDGLGIFMLDFDTTLDRATNTLSRSFSWEPSKYSRMT